MTDENSAFETGLALRRDMFGIGGADKAIDFANGVTKLELRELILHAHLYCGISAAVEATGICEGILRSGDPSDSLPVAP
jgi:hypothetical protein